MTGQLSSPCSVLEQRQDLEDLELFMKIRHSWPVSQVQNLTYLLLDLVLYFNFLHRHSAIGQVHPLFAGEVLGGDVGLSAVHPDQAAADHRRGQCQPGRGQDHHQEICQVSGECSIINFIYIYKS